MNKLPINITLLGILSLIIILTFSKPIEISSNGDLKSLIQNQKIQTSGKIIDQKNYDKITILKLENNITLAYSGKHINFLNENIEAIGIYDSFNYPKIKILKINIR